MYLRKKTAEKCYHGYILDKRKKETIKTILYFWIPTIIFLTGYYFTGTKKNFYTVFAALACLPACKQMVSMIMFVKSKGCSETIYQSVLPHTGNLTALYDLIFTTYDKTYEISQMVMKGDTICAFYESAKFDPKKLEEHVLSILKENGHRDLFFKVFTNLDKYLERLDTLQNSEVNERKQKKEIVDVILAITL